MWEKSVCKKAEGDIYREGVGKSVCLDVNGRRVGIDDGGGLSATKGL